MKNFHGVKVLWFGASTKIYHRTRILNTIEEALYVCGYITGRRLFEN